MPTNRSWLGHTAKPLRLLVHGHREPAAECLSLVFAGLTVGLVEPRSGDGRVELKAEFTQPVWFPSAAVIR